MTIDVQIQEDPKRHRNSFGGSSNRDNYNSCFQNYYHGQNYLNPNPKYITNVKANINHFQLRDLLQVDQSTGDLYFTKSYSLWKLNGSSSSKIGKTGASRGKDTSGAFGTKQYFSGYNNHRLTSSEILKPDYSPRCFNVTEDGAMVIGGLMTSAYRIYYSNIEGLSMNNHINRPQKGLFTFYSPETRTGKTVKLGEMINNAVLIDKNHNNNQYKSFVCNNDSSLYSLDIMNNDQISVNNKIVCEHDISLNNVMNSPTTNKLLAVTGDTSSVFLVDPTSNKPMVEKINTKHDSGFGISFHPNGNLFSVAFQDGNCLLYDLRNLDEPLHTIKSTRPGHQSGGFRCCKFSNSRFSDILVISEHVGRVHVIDLRNLNEVNNHQVIVFPFALDQYGEHKRKETIEAHDKNDYSHTENDHDDNDTENDENDENEQNEQNDNVYEKNNVTEHHSNIPIYNDLFDDTDLKFNAPLVYDYDYLTNVNPKLFKYYTYKPEKTQDTPLSPSPRTLAPIESMENSFGNLYNFPLRNTDTNTTYQNSDNHIQGEMELSGLDWYDSKLFIGCENGGIISWDVNYIARRSFGSFSFV